MSVSLSNADKDRSLSPDTFKKPLRALLDARDPLKVTPAQVRACLDHVFRPYASTPAQIGAFLAGLHAYGLDRRADIIAEAASVMRELCIKSDLDPNYKWVDIVGTGGDGKDTFNVSTSAAIVAAGAGCHVAKHGNRASSSTSGSADLLQSLDVPAVTLSPTHLETISSTSSFLFLFAPLYHPALGHLAPLRKEIASRTIFNILGPLVNPADPRLMIIGVPEPELGPIFADSLKTLDVERAWIVCGKEGLDEISISGPTHVWDVRCTTDDTAYFEICPQDFGLKCHPLETVAGGTTSTENAVILTDLLSGRRSSPSSSTDDPIENFVLINAAALLIVAGIVQDGQYKEAVKFARESISSGAARRALESFQQQGKRAMAGSKS